MKKGILIVLLVLIVTLSSCQKDEIEIKDYETILKENDLSKYKVTTEDLKEIQADLDYFLNLYEIAGQYRGIERLPMTFDEMIAPRCRDIFNDFYGYYPLLKKSNEELLVIDGGYYVYLYKIDDNYIVERTHSTTEDTTTFTINLVNQTVKSSTIDVKLSLFEVESGLDSIDREVVYVLDEGIYFKRLHAQDYEERENDFDLTNNVERTYGVITNELVIFFEIRIFNDVTGKSLPNAMSISWFVQDINGKDDSLYLSFETNLDADDFKEDIDLNYIITKINQEMERNDAGTLPSEIELLKRHF